jgi:prefoldin alpha subunit
MSLEEALNENIAMMDLAKAQMEGLARQQELLQLAIEEHSRAKETIEHLAKRGPGEDILVPVGADSFIYADVSDTRDAIVGVGSGVAIRRAPEDAAKILQAKMEDLSEALHKVTEKASELDGVIQQLSQKIQEQYESLRAAGKA